MSPRKARRLPDGLPRRPRGGVRPATVAGGRGDDDDGPAARLGPQRTETWPDGDWSVRAVPGPAATKTYRCPGCDQEIRTGVAHLVVWPSGSADADGRRHWHNPCWQRRPRRPAPGQGRR